MIKNLQRIFALTNKGAQDLVKATISSLVLLFFNMIPAITVIFFINDILEKNNFSVINYTIICVFALICSYILTSINYDTLYNATYRESANQRVDIVDTLNKLPISYFSKRDLSDISQTIMSDVERIENALSHAIPQLISFLIFLPIISIMLINGNPVLGVAIVIPLILALILIFLSKRYQIRATGKHYAALRVNSDAFQEAIELQQEIKSFNLREEVKKDLFIKMDKSEKLQIKSTIIEMIPLFLSTFFVQSIIAITIILGTYLYIDKKISLIYFIGYFIFSIRIKDIAEGLMVNITEIFYLDSRIKKINSIKNFPIQTGKDYPIDNYSIEFKNVSFAYGDNEILKDISFTAQQNQITALVGNSGCGKTTVLKLISRLYDYDKGSITIDNKDIKDIATDNLFAKISVVFQEVTLFNMSVMENIRLGKKGASDEEVIEAAKLANCEEFIEKLPNTYNTYIGENGANLSGGERQRLSIARAFLKNAPIILLDEIASALDVENEKKIQDSLTKLIKDKTVIIVTHRLKAIRNVDKIVVIDNGIVEASGNHEELLVKSKVYKNLIEKAKLAEEFKY